LEEEFHCNAGVDRVMSLVRYLAAEEARKGRNNASWYVNYCYTMKLFQLFTLTDIFKDRSFFTFDLKPVAY
jgi:hypothetical protein